MKYYSDFFNSNHAFIKNYFDYQSFWNEVLKTKLSTSRFQVVKCDSPDSLIKYFAVIGSGKVAIMLDPSLPEDTASNLLSQFHIDFNLEESEYFKEVEINHDKVSTIIFTSGSSGLPKAIELTHHNFLTSASNTNFHYGIHADDCWAMTLPFFHVGGLMIVYRTILAGAQTVFCDPTSISLSLRENSEITILSLVDIQLQKLLADKNCIALLQKLKGIVLGGAKTSEETLRQASSLKVLLSNSYGQTETCSQIFATPFTCDLEILKTVGKAIGNTKIEISSENVITIFSECIAKGIFKKENFKGKLITSDIAVFDENNNLCVTGRADDIYVSGGKNISPHSIDNQIIKMNLAISANKTVAVNDDKFGQVGVSFVESNTYLDHTSFLEKLRTSLPKYHAPRMLIQTKSFDTIKNGIKISRSKLESIAQILYLSKEVLGDPLIRGNLSKEILIVFHGFMGSYQDFNFLGPVLEEDYLVIYANLPGHNEKLIEKYNSFEEYLEDLDQVINSLSKLANISILGYSLGGRVASALVMHNKHVNTLLLESSGLGIPEEEKEARALKDEHLLDNIDDDLKLKEFLISWYKQNLFKGIENSQSYKKLINKAHQNVEGWKYSLRIMGQAKMPSIDPDILVSNTEQTIYIFGKEDTKYQLVANSFQRTILIPDASHNTHDTNRISYLEAIKSSLLK